MKLLVEKARDSRTLTPVCNNICLYSLYLIGYHCPSTCSDNSEQVAPTCGGCRMVQTAVSPTACKTCRRRGKRCDRSFPACMSCTQRGVKCEGYVTRWVGLAARGRLAGEILPNSRKKDSKRLRHSSLAQPALNSTAEASRRDEDLASSSPESISFTVSSPAEDHHDSVSRKHDSTVENISSLTAVCRRNPPPMAQQREPRIYMNALPDADYLQGLIQYCE